MPEEHSETHLTVARHEGILEGILETLRDIKDELKANRFWSRVTLGTFAGIILALLGLMQFVAKSEVADLRAKVGELERRVGVSERQIETYHQPPWSPTKKNQP